MRRKSPNPRRALPPRALPDATPKALSNVDRETPAWLLTPWFLPSAIAVLALAVLGPVLFGGSDVVLSGGIQDLATEFLYWRELGFGQLRHGHLLLWNPYVFSGTPFLGGWQGALLYPPDDVLYLLLPVERAINAEFTLHVFIAGLGMALWARYHGLHPCAALAAGAILMFCGPFFPHIYAGHLATVDAMAWAPYVLLAVDGLLDGAASPPSASRRRTMLKWSLLATAALSLELLAGHPQTLFNTAVTVTLYIAIRLILAPKQAGGVLAMAAATVATVCVCSVQIVAGIAAAAEGTRRNGISYDFASMLSFPPENFLTVIAPNIYGGMRGQTYWGHEYLWEVCVYCGVAGLALATLGLARSTNPLRLPWALMIVSLMWIALGSNTPLFHILYRYVPGFNRFRAHTKFIYDAALFAAIAAGYGLDSLFRAGRRRGFAAAVGIAGMAIAIVGAILAAGLLGDSSSGPWHAFVVWVLRGHDDPIIDAPAFLHDTQTRDGVALLLSAVILLVVAAFSGLAQVKMRGYAVAVVVIIEMVAFASADVTTFHPSTVDTPIVQRVAAADPGDYRILEIGTLQDNQTIHTHVSEIWGYDPTVLGRYAEFMMYSQGRNADDASMYLDFMHDSRMLHLFRLKYIFPNKPGLPTTITEQGATLPHAFLAANVVTVRGRDNILAEIDSPGFNIAKTAIVETAGMSIDSGSERGTITITQDSPGVLTVTADVSGRALAVITDSYSRYWRADALPGSSQRAYRVLPADYAAIGIPLAPGHDSFRLTYMPNGLIAAAWVSTVSALALFGVTIWFLLGERKLR